MKYDSFFCVIHNKYSYYLCRITDYNNLTKVITVTLIYGDAGTITTNENTKYKLFNYFSFDYV